MEQKIIKTDKKISLEIFSICLFLIIGMLYYIFKFFTDKIYQLDRFSERIIFFSIISIPFLIINIIELIKPSIILLINENGIQFSQGYRYFYSPWSNIVYFKDSTSSEITSIIDQSPSIDKQISIGFLNRKDVIEKRTFFRKFYKGINGEINIKINKTEYTAEEILKILAEYSKKYNPVISILGNTNIIDE